MSINLRPLGDIERRMRSAVGAGLREAAYVIHGRATERLNTLYPPASAKGQSPRRRSGDGRRSVFVEVDTTIPAGPAARVGTTSERLIEQGRSGFNYMAHHELSGRPWLLPAFEETIDAAMTKAMQTIASELGTP